MNRGKRKRDAYSFGQKHRQSSDRTFSDTLQIKSLSEQTLTLEREGVSYTYSRTTESLVEQGRQNVSEMQTKRVEGRLIIGHEVYSFVADGDTADYWVIDKSGELEKQYDELTKGQKMVHPCMPCWK